MKWPMCEIGEVFDVARGGSPRPIRDYLTDAPDGLNWIMIGDASEGSKYITTTKNRIRPEGLKKTRMVHEGHFLLTNSMSFGRPYILKTSGCIHDGWLVLSPKNDNAFPDFFYHLLGSEALHREFSKRAAGAVVKNLNTSLVKRVRIPLPPLAEQRRIAAILDRADAVRRKRREAIGLLDEFLRSAFLEMFGDPVRNEKGWEVAELDSFAHIVSGVTKGRKLKETATTELPYLRVANVQDGFLDLGEVKTIVATQAERARFTLRPGDILLTEGGDPDKLGRGAVWHGEIDDCIHQNHIFRVRLKTSKVLPDYVSALLGCGYGKRYFLRAAKQTTGIASINRAQLGRFPLLLAPTSLQRKYANIVAGKANMAAQLMRAEDESLDLFSSLSQRAFRGEV